MYSSIYYTIAGHNIAIVTPDAQATVALMTNFEPFRVSVNGDSMHCLPADILFHLSGGTQLSIPYKKADDDFDWNGILYKVYHAGNEIIIAMEKDGRQHLLQASANWRNLQTDLSLVNAEEWQFINNFIIVAFGMASAPLKTLKLHASVTEKDGKALLFMGKSGTGKSTHSRLWREFVPGCSLLNDDEPVVRLSEDGSVWVYGTPWSGKTPCYRNEKAEVKGFVHLYQSPENNIEQMEGMEAFSSLFSSSCMMRTDAKNKNDVFNTVADILEKTPVYRLDCRADKGAVKLTEALIK